MRRNLVFCNQILQLVFRLMQLLVNCISQRLVAKDKNSFDVIIDMHNSHVYLEVIKWAYQSRLYMVTLRNHTSHTL